MTILALMLQWGLRMKAEEFRLRASQQGGNVTLQWGLRMKAEEL